MNQIREKMMAGERVSGCERCHQEEDSGKKSLRQRYNNMPNLEPEQLITDLTAPSIKWLELALGNDCNLACRMCDSRYAFKWFDDEVEFIGKAMSPNKFTRTHIDSILPLLKDIVHIKFTGGEPLIIPSHLTILNELCNLQHVSNIHLNYSTNLTINPKKELIEKWSKFKRIEIACSFDGVDDTWEYVRYPSKWENVSSIVDNIISLTAKINCRVGLRSTISVNNILNMADSLRVWGEKTSKYDANNIWLNPTHLTYPDFLSTTVLPQKYKDVVSNQLVKKSADLPTEMKDCVLSQINYMYSADHSTLLRKLKDYTVHYDTKRNQNFFRVNKLLEGLFDDV